MSGDKLTIVVAHKDRIARFGVELIEWILQSGGSQLVVLNQSISDPQRELTEDLLAIIHIFSQRLYGQRRGKCNWSGHPPSGLGVSPSRAPFQEGYTNNKMSKDSSVSNDTPEEHISAVVRDLQSSLQQVN